MSLYEHVEEASTRLSGTVLLYKKQPVYCENVHMMEDGQSIGLRLILYPRGREVTSVPLTDPELEYFKYNLGYINLQAGATYAARIPSRGRYKQGLCKDNMVFSQITPNAPRVEWGAVYKTTGFRDMLAQTYPSFRESVERVSLDDGPHSVAFDPQFAISRDSFRDDMLLHYKGDRIGFGSDAFQIPSEFKYLREVIQKSGIKVR